MLVTLQEGDPSLTMIEYYLFVGEAFRLPFVSLIKSVVAKKRGQRV